MKSVCIAIALLLSACSKGGLMPVKEDAPIASVKQPETESVKEREFVEGQLRPTRTIDELLVQRLSVCSAAEEKRAKVLKQLSISQSPVNPVNEDQLNQLLLASCSPATKPGVLNQLLADLTSAGTWPEEYAAFFDLIISGQRAYAAVEKVYLDLKQEHEKTIQGLSEIESQIEKQNTASQP